MATVISVLLLVSDITIGTDKLPELNIASSCPCLLTHSSNSICCLSGSSYSYLIYQICPVHCNN